MVEGVRSPEVAAKIDLHLDRFRGFFVDVYGHERISTVGRRDVVDWQRRLAEGLAPATVNNHVASLSGFTTWVSVQASDLFTTGNPSTGISALPLPPLEPRSLTPGQVRSLKNLCDRLERYSQRKGPAAGERRPTRSVVATADLSEIVPSCSYCCPQDSAAKNLCCLTSTRSNRLNQHSCIPPAVPGSWVFGARGNPSAPYFCPSTHGHALADYLEEERPFDATPESTALFLSAASVGSRRPDGRLSGRSVNTILERLGHRSQRYIARYTNPPEHVATSYIEQI